MAAPLPLGLTVEAKLESAQSLASSVIQSSHPSLTCHLYLSISSPLLSPSPPSCRCPSAGLQCRNIIQMMANHRSLESTVRQPEINRPDNHSVSWLHWPPQFGLMFVEGLWIVQLSLVCALMVLLTVRTSAPSCRIVDSFQAFVSFLTFIFVSFYKLFLPFNSVLV